jgi:long-chain acyl-CoA synthetase
MFRSFATLEVRRIDELEKLDGPVFFVANHLSYFDQPSVMFALPPKIRYNSATAAWAEFFFGEYHGVNLVLEALML